MDLNLNDEERLLIEGASRWALESYDWSRREASVQAGGLSRDVWQAFADMGWLALAVPAEAGGLGLSLHHFVLLMSALGRGVVVEPLVSSALICTHLLARCTGKPIAAALLTEMAAGTKIVALAATERGAVNEVGVTARRNADGSFTLDGSVLMVVDAPAADAFLVAAVLDETKRNSLFLVPKDVQGLTMSTYALIDGRGAADLLFGRLTLSADAQLLADAGDAVDEALDHGVAANLGEAVGGMESSLAFSLDHLNERQQFGQALAKFQALQHLAAEMFVDVTQARSMLYYLLSRLGTPDQATAISECKMLICEAGARVTQRAMQIHGAIAFTEEFHIGHYYKRILTMVSLYGAEDYHYRRMRAHDTNTARNCSNV